MAALGVPTAAQVDQQRADLYFKEAAALCERDGGRLWGVSLCGPMVFADARTQTMATNQPPPAGERPRFLGFANAAIEWDGIRWATFVWDFMSDNARQHGELMLHELFHRIQPQLKLMTQNGQNEHLDAADGRYWLQLEWRALAQALRSSGQARTGAVRDALAFRAMRRSLIAGAAENERLDEIREGLAQYTGTVVTAASAGEATSSAINQLAEAEKQETFVRTFAYTSGVAYGILLDGSSRGWTRQVQATSDLGEMLIKASGIQPADNAAASAARYRGAELRAAEDARDEQRKARIAELRQRFVDGPVLVLPSGGGATSDARGATAIPGIGTVFFSTYRLKGAWGSLEATNGVLMSSDRGTRSVPAPVRVDGATVTGDGWTVTLAPRWVVRPGPRSGDYQVVQDGR
jgi:hypothetical protein